MRFEEVLPLMRQGKKARMKIDEEDGCYWVVATSYFPPDDRTNGIKTIAKIEKDGFFHPNRWSWGIPCWAVMAEDWEVIE